LRITELINEALSRGHKLDFIDMLTIQNDTLDVFARDIAPLISKIIRR